MTPITKEDIERKLTEIKNYDDLFEILFYFKNRIKFTIDGDDHIRDSHLSCPNWPNCDTEGCGG